MLWSGRNRARRAAAPGQASPHRSAKQKPSLPGWPRTARSFSPGPAAADVAHDQLEGPADRRVGAVALPERVAAAVHARPSRHRAVDDQDRADGMGRRQHAVDVEAGAQAASTRREHDRQILRRAARHDRVDRDLLDRRLALVRWHDADDLLGVAPRARRASHDPLGGRRDDRQPVGEPRSNSASNGSSSSPISSSRARSRPARRAPRAASRAATSARACASAAGPHLREAVEREWTPARSASSRSARGADPRRGRVSASPSSSTIAGTASGSSRALSASSSSSSGTARKSSRAACAAVSSAEDCDTTRTPRGVERRKHLVADGAVVLDERDELHLRRPYAPAYFAAT